jgi:hypothetical protein
MAPKTSKTNSSITTSKSEATPAPAKRTTKLETLTALLQRPEGASIAEMMSATGWQQHSVRGVLSGTLRKKGVEVVSLIRDGERRYSAGAS